jgi:hypothetical protein
MSLLSAGEALYILVMDFLQRFHYTENGFLAICEGTPANRTFVKQIPESFDPTKDFYFGPAVRKKKGNTKEDVLGTVALWVDADDPQKPLCTLPPSALVFSGHGWHVYWFLDIPLENVDQIETLNKMLADDIPTADKSTWNVNRVLRIPNTTNNKVPDIPIRVELKQFTGLVYNVIDFKILEKLSKQCRHKIRTGDSRGYRSRSERDWAIVTDLVDAGAADALIEVIFDHQPCGDKKSASPPDYFSHTLQKARARIGKEPKGLVEAGQDGYYVWSKRGARRVSTFTIKPQVLLDGSAFEQEDAIVGQVVASGYSWPSVTFSKGAFTSSAKIDRELPVAAWQWLGRDEDVRLILPFLLKELQENGLPKVAATSTLGMHFKGGVPYFIGDKQTLSPRDVWTGYEAPMAWLPSHREHPQLNLTPCDFDKSVLADIPLLNELDAIVPMLGWYAATPFKPWLESKGYRFPVLNVVGTRGSGKTTLIQRVFMPLFGQVDPKSYDAGTTRFVTLALMGSSNAVPVAFSEFRYEAVERFIRFVLLAYDTGHDPRGRSDQTTVDYPLSAPFSVDGEDMVEDPAAKQRMIVVRLHPDSIAEGTGAYKVYNAVRGLLPLFGGTYVQQGLQMLESGRLEQLLVSARETVFGAFPKPMPDRVRANHIVAYFGTMVWCEVLGLELFDPSNLMGSIRAVYDIDTGRSRTMADYMVEDLANAASAGASGFRWKMSDDGSILYFQLSSAHSWWLGSRRRQGRGALERDAIRAQIKESPYALEPEVVEHTWMYGVILKQAQDFGLDVPSHISSREMKIHF